LKKTLAFDCLSRFATTKNTHLLACILHSFVAFSKLFVLCFYSHHYLPTYSSYLKKINKHGQQVAWQKQTYIFYTKVSRPKSWNEVITRGGLASSTRI
jgi:hypothetical protein